MNALHLLAAGCHYTVSMALPGSILDNAQTPELKTYLAGQVGAQEHVSFSLPTSAPNTYIL